MIYKKIKNSRTALRMNAFEEASKGAKNTKIDLDPDKENKVKL